MKKAILILFACLCVQFTAHASDFYYAQTAQGGNTGANCANAFAYNDATNGMTHKAAAGNILHICGTWTGAAGQTWVMFTTSGSSGNPITLQWEAGASVQAPYHSTSGGFIINGLSNWLLIGQNSAGVNGTCNITKVENGTCVPDIENTLNGNASASISSLTVSGATTTVVCSSSCQPYINQYNSLDIPAALISGTSVSACNVAVKPLTSSGTTFTYATPSGCTTATGGSVNSVCPGGACTQNQNSVLISATGVTNVEIKNMNVGPSFIHSLLSGLANGEGISINGTNIKVHDNTLHDAYYLLNVPYTNDSLNSFFNNDLFHCSWVMLLAGAGTILQDFHFYNNHQHDISFSDGGADGVHGNGIHTFNQGSGGFGGSSPSGGIQAFYHYNNLADGDAGVATSGWPFFAEGAPTHCGGGTAGSISDWAGNGLGTASTGTLWMFNDVIVAGAPIAHPVGGVPAVACGTNHHVLNNYEYCGGHGLSGNNPTCGNFSTGSGATGLTMENNLVQSSDTLFQDLGAVSPAVIDFNIYGDQSGGNFAWQSHAGNTSTFATWNGFGYDVHGAASLSGQIANVNGCFTYECGAGVPSAGFIGLPTGSKPGTNLTSLCSMNADLANLCLDSTAGGTNPTPASRPSTGPWPVGPFQLAGGTLQFAPSSWSFGTVTKGVASTPITTTASNTTGITQTWGGTTITGTNAADFSIGTNPCTGTTTPCTMLNIIFTPSQPVGTAETAQINLPYAGPTGFTNPLVFTMSGTSGFAWTVSPTSVPFGTVPMNTTSSPQSVIFNNISGVTLTVTGATFTGPNAADFGETQSCGAIPNGSTCSVNVTFTPSQPIGTVESATLNLAYTGAGASPFQVAVGGTSGPNVTNAPTVFPIKWNATPVPVAPVPTLTQSSPASSYVTSAGISQDGKTFAPSLTMMLTGTNFPLSGQTCTFDGTTVACTCGSSTSCIVTVPAALIPIPKTSTAHTISVSLPAQTVTIPALN